MTYRPLGPLACWICGNTDPAIKRRLSPGCRIIICIQCEETIIREHNDPPKGWVNDHQMGEE